MPPCSMSSLIQAITSTAQSYKHLSAAELPSTIPVDPFLDGTKDGGGISESSSQKLRTPGAIPPSTTLYLIGDIPVFVQIQR